MHGASLVAFSASGWMVYQQLENKNNLAEGASYESNGMELFEVFGITVDLNIWLPILIAIPLFLLGQVLASAKHAASAAVVEERGCGVVVWSTKRSTMTNCNVSHSNYSGLFVNCGSMKIDGTGTTINHKMLG